MIKYKVVYSGRRTIGINITPDKGVTIRAPYRTSISTIEKVVASKSDWIRKYLERYSNLKRLNGDNTFADGDRILFRGQGYTLRVIESERGNVVLSGGEIIVSLTVSHDSEKIRQALRRWYNRQAAALFGSKMNELLQKYAAYRFSPTGFSVRTMRRRWGSCTSRGKITLNSELVKLEDIYTEYVILHELCHLHHPNHGIEYYRLLGEVFPQWKSVRKELKNYLG
jgi:predicted metal-dependent hydrolase